MADNRIYIGWDVGGWNCDRNANSRDALVVLDAQRRLLGKTWRGNLRSVINQASSTEEWIQSLLRCCQVEWQGSAPPKVVLAIDTPLGFSLAFQQLITCQGLADTIDDSACNPYLFRHTERYLFQHGLSPLSAVKDMIGSQATKGMHALAKFAPQQPSPGVWAGGDQLLAIEAYPSACKNSPTTAGLLTPFIVEQPFDVKQTASIWQGATFVDVIDHDDKRDALVCGLLAWLFANEPEKLQPPDANTPLSEGWIFVPRDGLPK